MDWYLLLTSEGRSWMINIKDDEKDNTGDPKEITKDDDSFTARNNTLTLIDLFVDRIFQIRRTLVGVSISTLVLAPISIGLSIHLSLQ